MNEHSAEGPQKSNESGVLNPKEGNNPEVEKLKKRAEILLKEVLESSSSIRRGKFFIGVSDEVLSRMKDIYQNSRNSVIRMIENEIKITGMLLGQDNEKNKKLKGELDKILKELEDAGENDFIGQLRIAISTYEQIMEKG